MHKNRLLFVVMCVVLMASSNASAKCKWKIKEPMHYLTKLTQIAADKRTAVAVNLGVEDRQYFLDATYASQFKRGMIKLDSATPLTMYFEGGEAIELAPISEAETKHKIFLLLLLNKAITARFLMTASQMGTLRDNALVMIHITFRADGELRHQDYTVKEKKARKFAEFANCVLSANE